MIVAAVTNSGCLSASSRPLLFQAQLPEDSEDIYQVDLGTGDVTRLTTGEVTYANSFPARSPIDDRIAFVRQRWDGVDSLFLMVPGIDSPRSLPTPRLPVLGPPAWSPDARFILISAGQDVPSRRLYVVNVDSSTFSEIPLPEGMFDCGSYSPGGDRLVASRSHGSASEVVIVDPSGGDLDVIVASDSLSFHCPEWSPSDEAVGVTTYSRDLSRAALSVVDLRSRRIEELSAGPGYSNALKWSPDGRTIAYQCTDRSPQDPDFFQRMEICIVGRDGTGRQQLTSNEYFDAHPSW